MRFAPVAAGLAVLLFSSSVAFAQSPTPTPSPFASDARPMLIAPISAADPQGAESMLFNPAAHFDYSGGEAVWIHSDRPQANHGGDGDAFFLAGEQFGAGVEWARPATRTSTPLLTLAAPFPVGRTFSTGVSLTSTFGKTYTPYSFQSWNFGALWQPCRFISAGATAWNAFHSTQPTGLDLTARYDGGIAIRPYRNYVTLSGDAIKTDGLDHVDLRGGVRIEPIPGFALYATGDDTKRYTAGFSISFRHARGGTQAFRDENEDYVGTATRLSTSARRQTPIAKLGRSYVKMNIGGELPDESKSSFFSPGVQTLPGLLRELARIRRDRGIDGVIVHLEGFGGGLARAQEVRDALIATHKAGKRVLCWTENPGFRTYYVATGCDKIALHPAGTLDITGSASELAYVKGTLDKVGVQVETARVGPYKGAPEPFLQKEPSKETLEVANAMLDASFDQTVAGIAEGRKLEPGKVRALIDGGFYDAKKAQEAGLIDFVCYPDELEKTAKKYLGEDFGKVSDYAAQAPVSRDWGTLPKIGVIYADGAITGGESRSTPLSGESVLGSTTLVRQLKAAANDPFLRAVVLRVDSPGGDGFASDEVWHEMERLKKKKPVIVSMGNVAASGGYYISQGATEIFADPGTVTGSIGVFLLKPNFKGLYEKADYHVYPLSRGVLSQLFTTSRPFTADEKEAAGRLIDTFYTDFITKAAAGRKTTPDAIDAVGRGHVWMGTKALELRLVDKIGGLEDAVARARELAKIPASREVEWVTPEVKRGRFGRSDDLPDELRAELSALAAGLDLGTMELLMQVGPGVMAWSPEARAFALDEKPRTVVHEERTHNPFWPLPLKAAE